MNPNELCDILLVIMGVCLIFFISTRKQKELFNICPVKSKKKIKKNKKKLKVKSFDKTLSNNSNISKAFLSKKEIKNTVNDQNVIINELNTLDDSNVTESNVIDSNVTDSNVTNFNVTDSNEIDGYMILDNYGNIELSESESKIINVSKSSNYNSQDLSELNNFDNLDNDFTSFDNNEIVNDLENTNNDALNETSDNLENTNEIALNEGNYDLQVDNEVASNKLSNELQQDNSFNNIYNKSCDREIKGNDKEDLVYGLLQNETKSYKKINVTNYENEKKCSTLKNAILNLNRTGYLKSDLVEKSWNDTFKPECGDL